MIILYFTYTYIPYFSVRRLSPLSTRRMQIIPRLTPNIRLWCVHVNILVTKNTGYFLYLYLYQSFAINNYMHAALVFLLYFPLSVNLQVCKYAHIHFFFRDKKKVAQLPIER